MVLISFFGLPTKLLCCRVTNSSVDKMLLLFLFSSKQQPSLIGFELLEFLNNAATCSRTRRSHPHTTLQITHLPTPLFFSSNFCKTAGLLPASPFLHQNQCCTLTWLFYDRKATTTKKVRNIIYMLVELTFNLKIRMTAISKMQKTVLLHF